MSRLRARLEAWRYRADLYRRMGHASRLWAFAGWCAALAAVAMIVWWLA